MMPLLGSLFIAACCEGVVEHAASTPIEMTSHPVFTFPPEKRCDDSDETERSHESLACLVQLRLDGFR